MRFIRKGHEVFLALGVGASLIGGCTGAARATPADTVTDLYRILIDAHVTGAPTAGQLAMMSPYLSGELEELLRAAGELRDSEATAHPGEKPPFADGDLFSSLFEGPTSLTLLATAEGDASRRLVIEFSSDRASPTVAWTDTVLVAEEEGRLVVADVIYGGSWPFTYHGSLREMLRQALRLGPSATGPGGESWLVRFDGIGPVRVGMLVAEAEALLGGTVRVDRVEPGDQCGQAYFSAVPTGVSFMLAGDTIVRVDVDTAGVRSTEGVGVGDREVDLVAQFLSRIRVEPHPYEGPEGHYLLLAPPDSSPFRMILETDGQRVTRFRGGRVPEVDLIEGCL